MQEVNLPAACQGTTKRLEEHAVGLNMAQFHNDAVTIEDLQPVPRGDHAVATGATAFCGVVMYGTLFA